MLEKHRLPSGKAGEPDLADGVATLSFYDVALAVLPVPLLVGLLTEELLALTPGSGTALGAVISALVVGYLLFGNPPMRRGPSPGREGASTGRDSRPIEQSASGRCP
ncbi:hypothetical protein [Halorussus litoreus]|uniref:hypothetical protein n=1 Tax=Halorussus litoreus TaxID=1710536 RepID=UPI001300922D|nr:hypothetical protein [Halorussus litoreus]